MTENNLRDFFLGCKECVLENPRSFYGSFTLGPFQNSQSLTLANALRRTLLTEIQNIAITHVEIAGVLHEYSLLEGIRESVLDILLAFKGIVLKTSLPFEKPLYGYLNARGPGIVRASDLRLPPNVSCVDPDQYIATLSENANLCLRFTVSDFCNFYKLEGKRFLNQGLQKEKSLGPTSASQRFRGLNKGSGKALHQVEMPFEKENFLKNSNPLFVDPNFNPVLKVSYIIENLEPVGGEIGKSSIHLEIWTNGSIHPRKAFYFTFDFLKNMLSKFDEMKHINKKLESNFFASEEVFTRLLKSIEYDFGFYDVSNFKKLSTPIQHSSAFMLKNEGPDPHSFSEKEQGSNFQPVISNGFESFLESSGKKEVKKSREENDPFAWKNDGEKTEKKRSSSIKTLNFPSRIHYVFIQNNILTIEDLLTFSAKELKNFCGIGNFSLSLIQKKLKKIGFSLKNE
jgi:DNA-directed RNA polymerase subunit alpha